MGKEHFIITGTSRGIGEQLAKKILEDGNHVYGISRSKSDKLERFAHFKHVQFDLRCTLEIDQMLNQIFSHIDIEHTDMICLVNNAAMLEPLKTIASCTPEEILDSVQISLIAPMILVSSFIQITHPCAMRRRVINISSGSAVYPAPGMSVYCAAKAGMNMFTQCVGSEQRMLDNPVEIVAIDPGMVDTELQAVARGKTNEQFATSVFFKEAYENGKLRTAEEVGNAILQIIRTNEQTGQIVSI